LDIILRAIPIVIRSVEEAKFVFASHVLEFQQKYGSLIEALNIEKYVLFCGHLDHTETMPYYCKDADVVVSLPSSDSSPASVYEAMACKTPVIISDLPWYEGKFEKDLDMVVVPVRNVEKLADAIIKVLDCEKKVDVDSAYQKVYKNINFETENRKLERLYQKILS
jgi:glycosyltransferase involved in cell wall biosynthesis